MVNAAISSAVLVAFLVTHLLRGTSTQWLTPYVDPCLVILAVVFTTIVPVRMAVQAVFRLLNRVPSREMVEHTTAIIVPPFIRCR